MLVLMCEMGRMAHNTHTHEEPSSPNADAHLQASADSAHDDDMNGKKLIEILHKILETKEWTQGDLAAELKVSQPTVSRWFDGSEPKYRHQGRILALARRLNVVEHTYALDGEGIPFVGYVGAGGQVMFSEGQGPFGAAEMPPVKVPPQTVALKVQGDSMSPQLEDGWAVYYDTRHEKPTESLNNRLCVVGLTDGRVLVKTLLHGRSPGSWDLHSKNAAPLFDQQIEWAARVTFIAPTK